MHESPHRNSIIALFMPILVAVCVSASKDDRALERLFRRAIEPPGRDAATARSRAAVQQLKEYGPGAVPFLCRKLENPCLPGIFTIREIITYWSSNAVQPLLEYHAATTNDQTRRIIVYYLGLIRDPRGRVAAEQEVSHPRNRSTALWTLGQCGITDAVPWAASLILTGEQQMVRVRSAGILRKLAAPSQNGALVVALGADEDWNVRCAAARGLAAHGTAGCEAITNAWPILSVSGKILGMNVLAGDTNFASAEVLKFYASDTNPFVAAHALRLLRSKDSTVTNTVTGLEWIARPGTEN
jgi:hypothetical protein